MKKEIGKWLMDIAKYVVTGGIISILRKEKGLKTVKKGGNSYGTLFILL
mgnify:CR=1 FL=1